MNKNTSSIVSKVWSFCNPLRDVGVSYGDYLEQLTYLLFLKMANEYDTTLFFKDFYLKNCVESFSATGKNILLNLSFTE
jgi:type I restriction-modification system DNA methylase subunit